MYNILSGKKDYVVFIKSTAKINYAKRTKENYSNFTFSQEDIERLKVYIDGKDILLCLVCHDQHICLLTKEDVNELKILDSNKPCRITAYWKTGSELRLESTFAKLRYKIPRSRLKMFAWEN